MLLSALAVIALASAPAAQAAADGKGKMKGYKDEMSAEEIKAVATYLKTIK